MNKLQEAGISWVIIGSQTKPNIFPAIEHVAEIVLAADKAGIPVFLKNNLRPLLQEHVTGIHHTWALAKNYGHGELWRQEFP